MGLLFFERARIAFAVCTLAALNMRGLIFLKFARIAFTVCTLAAVNVRGLLFLEFARITSTFSALTAVRLFVLFIRIFTRITLAIRTVAWSPAGVTRFTLLSFIFTIAYWAFTVRWLLTLLGLLYGIFTWVADAVLAPTNSDAFPRTGFANNALITCARTLFFSFCFEFGCFLIFQFARIALAGRAVAVFRMHG